MGARLGSLALTTAVVVALAAGCGGDQPPSSAVPALSDRLQRVDDAVVAQRYAEVRRSLDELRSATQEAEESGDLDPDDAERILTAADTLLAALPTSSDSSSPSPSPSMSPSPEVVPEDSQPPTPSPSAEEPDEPDEPDQPDQPDQDDERGDEEDKDKDEKEDRGKGEDKGKGKKDD